MSVRMRKKKNLVPRLAACAALLEEEPALRKGSWRTLFPGRETLALEIGCGKGKFTAATALREPEQALVALERVPEALVMAVEKAVALSLANVRYVLGDAGDLAEDFAPGELDRIYVNFCDPWPKKKHARRRLVHRDFLAVYSSLLKSGGEVIFKTDNAPLFDFALEEAEAAGFRVTGVSRDLAASSIPNVTTEYEEKFMALGTPINRAVFVRE